jgi:hypothetical protein
MAVVAWQRSTRLPSGTEVEVRNRYRMDWAGGFEIVGLTAFGYRLRRRSDGAVLPVAFSHENVRLRR